MKNIIKSFAALAASLLAFSACQNELNPEASSTTHSLKFVAESPVTKTSADLENVDSEGYFDFNWSETDKTRFSVYEIVDDNYVAATSVTAELVDGAMVLDAKFNGAATPGAKYFALLNTGVKSNQEATNTSYDQASDVLISEVVTSETIDDETLLLSFKRENAFALMTTKSLNDGAFVKGASITATNDKLLAAEYDYETKSFDSEGSNSVVLDVLSEIQDGEATIFVSTLPVEGVALNVGVVTVDNEENFVAAYEKSFKEGSTINFTRGDIRPFNIGMNKVESIKFDLTEDNTTTSTETELTWVTALATIKYEKNESDQTANSYVGGQGVRSSTRFYNKGKLTITPHICASFEKVMFDATTENYAKALRNSTWATSNSVVCSNAVQASTGHFTFNAIPTDGQKEIVVDVTATCGFNAITIFFGIPDQGDVPVARTISISSPITGGSVTADKKTAYKGEVVTLTANANTGYDFSSWSVVNDETSESIEVYAENTFVMPNANVTVSATFSPISYTVTLNDTGATLTSEGGAEVTLPSRTNFGDFTFLGWCTENVSETTTRPTIIDAGPYVPESNITLYPVYSYGEGSDGFKLSLVYNSTTYYVGAKGTGSFVNAPTNSADAVELFIETDDSDHNFLYYIYSEQKQYLSITANGTSLTVNNTKPTVYWTIADSNGTITFKTTATGTRNLAFNYNSGSPRFAAYTGSNTYPYQFTKIPTGVTYYLSNPEIPTIQSLDVSGTPTKMKYVPGDDFETAGLIVTATMSNSRKVDVTSQVESWTITPSGHLAEGTTSVNVVATIGTVSSATYTVNGLSVAYPMCAKPTADKDPGAVASGTSVTLNCSTEGSIIYYSIDDEFGSYNQYSTAIIIDEAKTIYAYAEATGYSRSSTQSFTYTIDDDGDGTDYTVLYTSNVSLPTSGTNVSSCKVKISDTEYDGSKFGTGRNTGSATFTIPAGTTTVHVHCVGWNGDNSTKVKFTINGTEIFQTPNNLTTDSGVAGNSATFTLAGTASDYYYSFNVTNITKETTITVASTEKRFVLFGVNAE